MQNINDIIDKWNADPDYVIEMMQDIQDKLRHTPREALEQVAKRTKVPLARLYHIATFYKSFSLIPRGKFEIQVCVGTACHVKGAPLIVDTFSRELKIQSGETTKDGLFSLEGVRCLGCCSLAPVVIIGDDLYSNVKTVDVTKLISKYRKEEK